MKDGFLRVCTATPEIRVADCAHNAAVVTSLAGQAAAAGASLVVFPELCLTGYTCGDLFLQTTLLQGAEQALQRLAADTKMLDCLIVVGLPVACGAALYNCAAVVYHGEILGLVPKTYIPNYGEFYEQRHFSAAGAARTICIGKKDIPLGSDLLFACRELPCFILGLEICEDLWVAEPPSSRLCAYGATVIANPSASDEVIGKAAYRRQLVTSQSARTISAYLYADAGEGESTTDLVFSGHNFIAENGAVLAESARFSTGLTFADVDLQRLVSERLRTTTYQEKPGGTVIPFSMPLRTLPLNRKIAPLPFVPDDGGDRARRCEEIFSIQSAGLCKRLRHTNSKTAVLGLSGGLDSTLALLVTAHSFDRLGLGRSGILAVSMPCFGTTRRTKTNAQKLAESMGCTFREIPIGDTVSAHLNDIGHDPAVQDATFENAQARERTQVLMDLANQYGGLVVGTGDLSELALGWATYNGDHMSMYGVNASIPKTLVRHLVAFEASRSEKSLAAVLLDILDTPVSPELLPPKDGEIAQKTEEIVGPYELHDFFLYYMLRFGFSPAKIFRLACLALGERYPREEILRWLKTFYRRFFSQQFKRSCLPDGPKVGTVALSPRGDWRMPSDASAALWRAELETLA